MAEIVDRFESFRWSPVDPKHVLFTLRKKLTTYVIVNQVNIFDVYLIFIIFEFVKL